MEKVGSLSADENPEDISSIDRMKVSMI
jgi:hypothetical protein